jgi:hypothetical protein
MSASPPSIVLHCFCPLAFTSLALALMIKQINGLPFNWGIWARPAGDFYGVPPQLIITLMEADCAFSWNVNQATKYAAPFLVRQHKPIGTPLPLFWFAATSHCPYFNASDKSPPRYLDTPDRALTNQWTEQSPQCDFCMVVVKRLIGWGTRVVHWWVGAPGWSIDLLWH